MEAHDDPTPFARGIAYIDQLAYDEETRTGELKRIEQAYREIQRRDGAAQWHTRLWQRFALVLVVALLACVSVIVSLAMKASRVAVFVQPVQLTDEGTMVLIGVPQDLLAYQPQDSEWMDMLAQWVTKRRWKGDESGMKRTMNDWSWLSRHSCGLAAKQLKREEEREQPFKASKARSSIEIKSITKTATPSSHQVTWKEVTIDSAESTLREVSYIGTFTVGRVRPKNLAEAMDNRLGLCVSGYDITPSSTRIP